MAQPNIVDVRMDLKNLTAGLGQFQKQIRQATATGINRAVNSMRTAFVREATTIVNVKARDLRQFIRITRASSGSNKLTGVMNIAVRAVPLHFFGARVKMKMVDTLAFGKYPVRRRLPTITVKLYKKDKAETIAGAFPLRQRTTGKLSDGEKVRKRTGPERGKLTGLRFYILPPELVRNRLVPAAAAAGGAAFVVQFRAAFRNRLGNLRQPPG